MSYKPEKITRNSMLSAKARSRAARDAKKAAARVMRRAARLDPEGAPTRLITSGWID